MTSFLTPVHRKRFEEIRRKLTLLGSKENNFLQVQLLFYDVLTIAKEYGDSEGANVLLAQLRQLEQNEFTKANVPTVKQNQKESNIKQFVVGLKKVLTAY